MIDLIGEKSKRQGFPKSRLPVFTEKEIKYIKGTSDFLGMNSYTTFLATPTKDDSFEARGWAEDINVTFSHHPEWEHTAQPLFKVNYTLENNLKINCICYNIDCSLGHERYLELDQEHLQQSRDHNHRKRMR